VSTLDREFRAAHRSSEQPATNGVVKALHALAVLGALGAAIVAPQQLRAQAFPDRLVRFVVPFPAGGPVDVLARPLAQGLSAIWGQPVIVENRPGAAGNIGTEQVAKSPPDGYTLLLTTSALSIAPSLFPKLGYDPAKDFLAVINMAVVPAVLVVHPSIPVHSAQELVALARAQPGKIAFASPGTGTPLHLAAELFKTMTQIDILHVPYKGGAPAEIDLVGGHVAMMFAAPINALRLVRDGKLRALAVTGATRSALAPDIPTLAEAGVAGYEATLWYGVLAPVGTPADIVQKINGDVIAVIKQPKVKEQFIGLGAQLVGNSPDQFAAEVQSDIPKWARVVQVTGTKLD
jgi:tripartite-type tricarboxylate transporter receptor subunit TctC